MQNMNPKISHFAPALFLCAALSLGACSEPLSTREKAAGIGALGGAAAGGLIGSAVGHPGAGAAIGGGVGLGAGAIIGDQMQRHENDEDYRR
jgi:outer membrane lipoprotein SlyB